MVDAAAAARSATDTLKAAGGHMAEAARGVGGYVSHTATRIGNHVGAPGAWESISKSGMGQFVGRHKIGAGVVAAATLATVAYNMGGNHRARLAEQRQQQGMER